MCFQSFYLLLVLLLLGGIDLASVKRICSDCGYSGITSEANGNFQQINNCPKCGGPFEDRYYYGLYNNQQINKKVSKLKQFDVQRVESLMRYAEFLREMNASQEKINRVIEMIHDEVGGYVEPVNVTRVMADVEVVAEVSSSLHPNVKEFISQEVKRQTTEHLDAEQITKALMRRSKNVGR